MNTARFMDNLRKERRRIKIAQFICDLASITFITLAVLITVLLFV